jgi:hypothetical protein
MDVNIWEHRITYHLEFLERMSNNPKNFDRIELIFSFHLYRLLMQLCNEFGESNIWFPEHILWMFHCHTLRPVCFAYDCNKAFGKILAFNPNGDKLPPTTQQFTRDIFHARYGFPLDDYHSIYLDDVPSKFYPSENIVIEALKQEQFTKVAKHLHGIENNVEQSLKQYLRMLDSLKNNSIQRIRLPYFVVDFIWHVHMCYTEEYLSFVEGRIGPYVIDHRDGYAYGWSYARKVRHAKDYIVVSCSCFVEPDYCSSDDEDVEYL